MPNREPLPGNRRVDNRQPSFSKTLGAIALTVDTRRVIAAVQASPTPQLVQVLGHWGIATSSVGTVRH